MGAGRGAPQAAGQGGTNSTSPASEQAASASGGDPEPQTAPSSPGSGLGIEADKNSILEVLKFQKKLLH